MTTLTRRRRAKPQQPTPVVKAHVTSLLAHGMTRSAIVADTGVCDRTITSVLACTTRYVRGETAHAILTTQPRPTTRPGLIPAVGTARRIQALIVYGYTATNLSEQCDISRREIWNLATSGQHTVDVTTRNRVVALFEKLSATPGPSDSARRLGRSKGWAVPAAWDDIDNPEETPAPARYLDSSALINKVLAGNAHINLLTARQETVLWHRWANQQRDAGRRPSARRFAAQFRIGERRAGRISATATTSQHDTNHNRKVA